MGSQSVATAGHQSTDYLDKEQGMPLAQPSLDVWSVGAVLYELASGRPLFSADR